MILLSIHPWLLYSLCRNCCTLNFVPCVVSYPGLHVPCNMYGLLVSFPVDRATPVCQVLLVVIWVDDVVLLSTELFHRAKILTIVDFLLLTLIYLVWWKIRVCFVTLCSISSKNYTLSSSLKIERFGILYPSLIVWELERSFIQ